MKKFFFYFLALFFFFAILFQALWLLQVDYSRLTRYGIGFIAGKLIVMGVTGYLLFFFIRRLRKTR